MNIHLLSKYIVPTVITILATISILSLSHKGLTYDESTHFSYATKILRGNALRDTPFLNSKMPVTILNTIISRQGQPLLQRVYQGRYVTILAWLLLLLLVFHWTKKLYGTIPALFSFLLCSFDPNLLAHGQLVTSDVFTALVMTMSCYCFWRVLNGGGYKWVLLCALVVAFSQLVKYTMLFLYPFLVIMLCIKFVPEMFQKCYEHDYSLIVSRCLSFIRYCFLFLIINIVIINLGFGFHKSFIPLKSYSFESADLRRLQENPILKNIPVPLPYAYLQGLDLCQIANDRGHTVRNTYLLGKLHENGEVPLGFSGYFFVVMLFKTPIPLLMVFFLALYFFVRRFYEFSFLRNEVFLLLPLLASLIYFNYFYNVPIGLRYILFIYPLIYIFCGSLFTHWNLLSKGVKIFLLSLICYAAASTMSFYPHFISYVNEFVPDRKESYRLFTDSNLDWGGNEWFLGEYLKAHPESIVSPEGARSGRIIVGVNDLTGVFDKGRYEWLRDHFEPEDHIAYSYLIYNVPDTLSNPDTHHMSQKKNNLRAKHSDRQ